MLIKVEAKPQPSPYQKCFVPRNANAVTVLYMTRREYLDENDLYVLAKLGHKIELTTKKEEAQNV